MFELFHLIMKTELTIFFDNSPKIKALEFLIEHSYGFYKFLEENIPKEKQNSLRASFRAELERRLGPDRVRELDASIVGRI